MPPSKWAEWWSCKDRDVVREVSTVMRICRQVGVINSALVDVE